MISVDLDQVIADNGQEVGQFLISEGLATRSESALTGSLTGRDVSKPAAQSIKSTPPSALRQAPNVPSAAVQPQTAPQRGEPLATRSAAL